MSTPEQKAKEATIRAAAAKRIFEDPIFTQAVVDVRATLIAAWGSTRLNDRDTREQLWMQEQCLQRVLRALRNTMEAGKVAEADILARKSRFPFMR